MPLPGWLARSNRRVLNPMLGRISDRVSPFATLHHVGRNSGRAYTTPIMAFRQPHGFVIALTYGTTVQWLRNVESAGTATLTQGGVDYKVATPRRLHGAAGAARVPAWTRRLLGLMQATEFAALSDV